jgi:molybdopterin biosynthesis enzyme
MVVAPLKTSAKVRKLNMARSRLRIYYGPEKACTTVDKPSGEGKAVRVPLGEIMPLLADAVQSQRTWLRDFEDDEVTISADLYEVILAYQHCRRPSA